MAVSTKSIALHAEGALYAPGAVNTHRRKINPPLSVAYGRGGYLFDVDGNRYIDFLAAQGAIGFGHGDQRVTDAVMAQAPHGVLYGIGITEAEVGTARRLVQHVPSIEGALLNNSGTEAVMHALRLARAATGRDLIIKFAECYHGGNDNALPLSTGIPDVTRNLIIEVPYNDLNAVATTFILFGKRIAAVIVEPIAHNKDTILPAPGFLEGLRAVTEANDAVLIFDEVISGVRHGIGGYQAICGVTPDLTTMAKALGNGYHIAAVGGRADLMEQFGTTPHGEVHYGGTFSGGLAGVVAANAVLDAVAAGDVTPHLFALGDRMRTGLTAIIKDLDLPATVTGYGSIYGVNWTTPVPGTADDAATAYRRLLLEGGVLELPEPRARNSIMAAHTVDDIDRALSVSLDAMQAVARLL